MSRRQSVKSGGVVAPPIRSGRWTVVLKTCTSASGCGYGSGRRSTAFTTAKIAALPPMPSASVSSVAAVNTGFASSVRTAYFRSCPIISILQWSQRSQPACSRAPAARQTHRVPAGRPDRPGRMTM